MKNYIIYALAAFTFSSTLADEVSPLGRNGTLFTEEVPIELKEKKVVDKDNEIFEKHPVEPSRIPHDITGYKITKDSNVCMSCHQSATAEAMGSTKLPESHKINYDGEKVDGEYDVRRHFCLSCHVPQIDAEPLIENLRP